ncbi:hypothetical protein GN958_ATG08394 [Phytophthora infestans]|uniref:Uncharacterized protein n=1 Tax=Phytophthora infestans TaxID=4787 RepID=A0A8S9UVN1_PHYIN|nr:hypothetical protein GN958_ATG08394 [Phytophthora infestans]
MDELNDVDICDPTSIPGPTVSDHPALGAEAEPAPLATSSKKSKIGKRLKWSDEMIAELLRLRFVDGDVKHRLESAKTKTQTALAWQNIASVLPQSLSSEQARMLDGV